MQQYIAFDAHKRYTLAEIDQGIGRPVQERIEHRPGAIEAYLRRQEAEPGTAVAVESIGSWYWIVEEIERAGCVPRRVHPRKAKLMMGSINKSDKLDVHGLNLLQRSGTLPVVWIAPGALRDLRELTRVRMVLTQQRTRLKNRLAAVLAKYALASEDCGSDAFAPGHRQVLLELLEELPQQTRFAAGLLLEQLDFVAEQIGRQEQRLKEVMTVTPAMRLLDTLPGVGVVLAAVLAMEIGPANRFASAEQLASYGGTTPRLHASGGKIRHGSLRSDVNRYVKWALMEAANVVALNHRHWGDRHVGRLYGRLRQRKGHHKAVGAVARHLAEACYHVLSRNEPYRDPAQTRRDRTGCQEGVSAVSS